MTIHTAVRAISIFRDFGIPQPKPMLETFREILAEKADDGVTFDAETLRMDRIREGLEYGGLRLRVVASTKGNDYPVRPRSSPFPIPADVLPTSRGVFPKRLRKAVAKLAWLV